MTRKCVWLAVAALTTGSLLIGLRSAPSQAPAAGDFAGKVLSVSSRSHPESGAVLEKVQVRTLGGKPFLVGVGIDDGNADNWQKGRTIWVAVEDVAQLVEFENLEQFKRAAAQFRR